MYSDDIFSLIIDIGHSKSVIGYAGDETPKYYTNSVVGHLTADSHQTTSNSTSDITDESAHHSCIFGEQISGNLKNVEIDNILENGACRYHFYQFHDMRNNFIIFIWEKMYSNISS
jgi:actin-related protein